MENNKLILIIAILILIAGGVIVINVTNPTEEKPSKEVTETKSQDSKSTNKTDAEVMLEGAKLVKGTYDEIRENKLKKDSLRKANRKNKWVYQIGLPTNNSLSLLDAYNQLKNFSNIKVFKSGRKSYFLYKDDGYTEQQLRDSLSSFQAKLNGIGSKVEIIDLMTLCSLKEDIVKGENIKVKKADVVLLCTTCD